MNGYVDCGECPNTTSGCKDRCMKASDTPDDMFVYEFPDIPVEWSGCPNPSKEQVREFHLAFKHPVVDGPRVQTPELRELRCKLIVEEAMEFVDACGFDLILHDKLTGELIRVFPIPSRYDFGFEVSPRGPDIIKMADGLGDLDVVVQGANLVFGFPSEKILIEIHRSNMSKLGADGKPIYRADGKILKGPNYSPPDIHKIIFQALEPE